MSIRVYIYIYIYADSRTKTRSRHVYKTDTELQTLTPYIQRNELSKEDRTICKDKVSYVSHTWVNNSEKSLQVYDYYQVIYPENFQFGFLCIYTR